MLWVVKTKKGMRFYSPLCFCAHLSHSTHPLLHSPYTHPQGDFNFQPTWPQYQLITEGEMSTEHAHYPPMPSTDPWTPRVEQPLKSALKAKWGQEPEFTCYSYADRVRYI